MLFINSLYPANGSSMNFRNWSVVYLPFYSTLCCVILVTISLTCLRHSTSLFPSSSRKVLAPRWSCWSLSFTTDSTLDLNTWIFPFPKGLSSSFYTIKEVGNVPLGLWISKTDNSTYKGERVLDCTDRLFVTSTNDLTLFIICFFTRTDCIHSVHKTFLFEASPIPVSVPLPPVSRRQQVRPRIGRSVNSQNGHRINKEGVSGTGEDWGRRSTGSKLVGSKVTPVTLIRPFSLLFRKKRTPS